ncbi:MAG: lamin tail domain-containing protein [Planctomycetota bacterium]
MIRHLAAISLLLILVSNALGQTLRIYVIDVGQGSSTLIISPTGQSMLIDGGPDQSGWINSPSGPGVIPQTMAAAGIAQLDYTLLTHYHSDHYEGITEIATHNYLKSTAKCYDRGNSPAPENGFTAPINAYISAIGAKRQTMTAGTIINLGGGATITCKVVAGQIAGGPLVNTSGSAQLENSNSIAVVLSYNNFELFVGGDLTGGGGGTTNVENPLAPFVGDVDVYIANHHGSSTSSAATFINTILPEVSFASCGLNNSFNHPSGTFLNNVNKATRSTLVYGTTGGTNNDGFGNRGYVNGGGTIKIESDGNLYQITPVIGKVQTILCDELTATYAGPSSNDLRISEYMPDPSAGGVPDDAGEWFEITNVSGFERNLNGLKFSHSDGVGELFTYSTPLLLKPGESFVFARSGDSTRNGGIVADHSMPFGIFALANGSDSILMRNSVNTTIDTISYTASWPDSTGVAGQRINLLTAGSLMSNWSAATASYGLGDKGTPGSANTANNTIFPAQFVSVNTPTVGGTWNVNFTSFNEPGDIYVAALSESTSMPHFDLVGLTLPLLPDALLFESLNLPGFINFFDGNGFATTTVAVPNDAALHGYSFFACVGVLDFPSILPGKVSAVVSITIP